VSTVIDLGRRARPVDDLGPAPPAQGKRDEENAENTRGMPAPHSVPRTSAAPTRTAAPTAADAVFAADDLRRLIMLARAHAMVHDDIGSLHAGRHAVQLSPRHARHRHQPSVRCAHPACTRNVRLAALVHGRDVCLPCWDAMREADAAPRDVPYAFRGTGWLRATVDKCVVKALYARKHSARAHWTHAGAVGA
jgi:hypothetical protein